MQTHTSLEITDSVHAFDAAILVTQLIIEAVLASARTRLVISVTCLIETVLATRLRAIVSPFTRHTSQQARSILSHTMLFFTRAATPSTTVCSVPFRAHASLSALPAVLITHTINATLGARFLTGARPKCIINAAVVTVTIRIITCIFGVV